MLYKQQDIIKHYRKAHGMTQAQLAEGICSRKILATVENGTHKLGSYLFQQVLLKLGLNPSDFNVGIEMGDDETIFYLNMQQQLLADDFLWNRTKKEATQHQLLQFIREQSVQPQPKNQKNLKQQQWLTLMLEAHLHMPSSDPSSDSYQENLGTADYLKARTYLMDAIRIFRPDFELAKFTDYYLSFKEFSAINLIASTFSYTGDHGTCLAISQNLRLSYEKNLNANVTTSPLFNLYTRLLTNITIDYRNLNMWEACLHDATTNMDFYLSHNHIIGYSRAVYFQALSLMKLGRIVEGKLAYNRLFMLAKALDGHMLIDFDLLKKEYETAFGLPVDTSVSFC